MDTGVARELGNLIRNDASGSVECNHVVTGAFLLIFHLLPKLASFRLPVARECFPVRSQADFQLVKWWCRRRDLNPRPPAYEADALPLSYAGLSWATDIGAHCALQAISEIACAAAARH